MKSSPLYRDSMALCGVLLEELEGGRSYAPLRRRLAEGAIRLVDQVVLALAGDHRSDRIASADAELRALRAHLVLAHELGVLDQEVFLSLAEHADTIGRQIGGWRRKLERVS